MICFLTFVLLGVGLYAAVAIVLANVVGIAALLSNRVIKEEDVMVASVLWPTLLVAIGIVLWERLSYRIQRMRPYFKR